MEYTSQGVELTKPELVALLAFASDDPKAPQFYGVHFMATEEKIKARAADGFIALDAVGGNDTGEENEWFVHRDFLKGAVKILDNSSTLVLEFSGASLTDAVVRNEDGVNTSTFSWPEDAANSQSSFANEKDWGKLLTPPNGKGVKCVTLNADYLGLMSKVSKAAGVTGIDCYPPTSRHDKVMFRCEGFDTTWIALVMPMRSDESENE